MRNNENSPLWVPKARAVISDDIWGPVFWHYRLFNKDVQYLDLLAHHAKNFCGAFISLSKAEAGFSSSESVSNTGENNIIGVSNAFFNLTQPRQVRCRDLVLDGKPVLNAHVRSISHWDSKKAGVCHVHDLCYN